MRKTRPQQRLWQIVLGLVILPPLGLFMLWRSSRTLRVKIVVSTVLVLVVGAAVVGLAEVANHKRLAAEDVPPSGFDVTYDSRGHYRNNRILPLERDVFNAVVSEMRRPQPMQAVPPGEIVSEEMVHPEAKAFEVVADRFGLDYEDVKAIYLKVSVQLVEKTRH